MKSFGPFGARHKRIILMSLRRIKRDIVSALIFSKDDKLLLGKKDPKKGGVYSDCWHIPGGGVDKEEDLVNALKREVLEEVGIDIAQYPLELVDNTDTGVSEKLLKDTNEKVVCEMFFNVYKVVVKDKSHCEIKVGIGDDLAEYRWAAIPELKFLRLTPPSIRLFAKLGYI